MLVSVDESTSALRSLLESSSFAVNYLPASARDVADRFGFTSPFKGADRFEPSRWGVLTTGSPVLNEALGVFDCVLDTTVRSGRTTIVIGRVVDFSTKSVGEPLVYFRGQYRSRHG
jgi:flavin reductase (DIM6/NTAB) family NADH-FMN oxidoreductase RutF